MAWMGCPTGTSATAACTSGSTSRSPNPAVAAAYRTFVEQAATLVASYGGSMSGEHGDGRARSALLPAMYSPAALDLFGQVKACFDPDNLLNPGVLVDPRPVDADLRTDARGRPGGPVRRRGAPLHRRRQVPGRTTPPGSA